VKKSFYKVNPPKTIISQIILTAFIPSVIKKTRTKKKDKLETTVKMKNIFLWYPASVEKKLSKLLLKQKRTIRLNGHTL